MLRRILAITLLIAFGSPIIAPLFAATTDPEASLPACCRRHGKHHCSMTMSMLLTSSGPAFQAQPCPFYPAAATQPRIATASLATPPELGVVVLRDSAPPVSRTRHAQTFAASAHPTRGPPARLA